MSGWIKVYRSIFDDEWYFSEKFTREQAWIDLLLLAEYKPKVFMIRNNKVHLERGQLAISIRNLSERWKWGINKVQSFIKELEELERIDTQKSHLVNIISICNYDIYQEYNPLTDTQTDTQTDTPLRNIKNNKEYNKEANASTSSCDDSAIDFNKLMSYWNDKMANKAIPRIKSMSKKRKSMVNARIQEYGKRAVFDVINYTSESLFLNGGGDKGAVFDFDWVFRPNNFLKVLEGNYNIKRTNNGAISTSNQSTREQREREVAELIARRLEKNKPFEG